MARKPAFLARATSPTIHVLGHLMNGIEMESIASMSRGGHSFDLKDNDIDDETESDDDDQDTDNENDSDDEVEESSGDDYDSDEETDNNGSHTADNDFYYFLFIDSNVNG